MNTIARATYKSIRERERVKNAILRAAADRYFRVIVYSSLRIVFVAAVLGIAVAVLRRYA